MRDPNEVSRGEMIAILRGMTDHEIDELRIECLADADAHERHRTIHSMVDEEHWRRNSRRAHIEFMEKTGENVIDVWFPKHEWQVGRVVAWNKAVFADGEAISRSIKDDYLREHDSMFPARYGGGIGYFKLTGTSVENGRFVCWFEFEEREIRGARQ